MDWAALNIDLASLGYAPDELRDGLARLYEAIAGVPETLLQDFARLAEADLMAGVAKRAQLVAAGTMQVALDGDDLAALLDAGRLLRAIEANLVEPSHYIESDRGEDLEDAWRTGDGRHYVVPRMTGLAPADGKPFLRRALLHYRILPTQIGAFKVRLHRAALAADAGWAARERTGEARHFGAAFFPDLRAILSYPTSDTFTVADISGCDAERCIAGHLAEARAAECRAIMWGELTMPQASVDRVRSTLASTALEGCGPLRYVVAGSWHVEIGGEVRNQCQVLDGYGAPICDVFKWAKFVVGGKFEGIAPGDEIHVLVGEDELTAIAICRDFLQATTDLPYLKLNVDVMLVPSMILEIDELKTLANHAATANTMRVRYGTRTLVVAQPAIPKAGGVGQLLAFPAFPLEEKPQIVDGPWQVSALAND